MMNAAEFRIAREHMGLPLDWLARHFGVNLRSISRWEAGTHMVPVNVAEQMLALESYTDAFVRASARRALSAVAEIRLVTPRTDDGMRDHFDVMIGTDPFPASWHRAATARIRDALLASGVPAVEVVVVYAEDDAEVVDAELVDG